MIMRMGRIKIYFIYSLINIYICFKIIISMASLAVITHGIRHEESN